MDVPLRNFFWSYGVGKTKWHANKCTGNWNGVFCLEMFSREILLRNMISAYHWHPEIQQNLKRPKKCLRPYPKARQGKKMNFQFSTRQNPSLPDVKIILFGSSRNSSGKYSKVKSFLFPLPARITFTSVSCIIVGILLFKSVISVSQQFYEIF